MKLFKCVSKADKAHNAKLKYEQALKELDGEIKKAFGEQYGASDVSGEGLVICDAEDELGVAPVFTVLRAVKENTFTRIKDYTL